MWTLEFLPSYMEYIVNFMIIPFLILFFRYYDQLVAIESKFPISENQVKYIFLFVNLIHQNYIIRLHDL